MPATKKTAIRKKAPARKVSPKKKSAAKKAPARKVSPKKKSAAKKAPARKVSPKKKSAAKKAPARKVSPKKKSAAKKAPAKKKAPVGRTSPSRSSVSLVERPPAVVTTRPTFEPVVSEHAEEKKRKKAPIWFFLVFGAIVLIATAVATNSDSTSTPAPQASPSQTISESPAAVAELGAPVDVFADYTPTGAKITWNAPSTADQLTGYLVQSSYKDGEFKTIAQLDSSALSLEVMKIDTPGFTTFRVVALYGEQQVTSDISELKGQYEG